MSTLNRFSFSTTSLGVVRCDAKRKRFQKRRAPTKRVKPTVESEAKTAPFVISPEYWWSLWRVFMSAGQEHEDWTRHKDLVSNREGFSLLSVYKSLIHTTGLSRDTFALMVAYADDGYDMVHAKWGGPVLGMLLYLYLFDEGKSTDLAGNERDPTLMYQMYSEETYRHFSKFPHLDLHLGIHRGSWRDTSDLQGYCAAFVKKLLASNDARAVAFRSRYDQRQLHDDPLYLLCSTKAPADTDCRTVTTDLQDEAELKPAPENGVRIRISNLFSDAKDNVKTGRRLRCSKGVYYSTSERKPSSLAHLLNTMSRRIENAVMIDDATLNDDEDLKPCYEYTLFYILEQIAQLSPLFDTPDVALRTWSA